MSESVNLFCVSVIWGCAIWAICDLKNWLWRSITSKSYMWHYFYDVMKIVLSKIRHQNDVTFFLFSSPFLSKTLVALQGGLKVFRWALCFFAIPVSICNVFKLCC